MISKRMFHKATRNASSSAADGGEVDSQVKVTPHVRKPFLVGILLADCSQAWQQLDSDGAPFPGSTPLLMETRRKKRV